MPKPQPKVNAFLTWIDPETRMIHFLATDEVASELGAYGKYSAREERDYKDSYSLWVDPRFDFKEVVAWVLDTFQPGLYDTVADTLKIMKLKRPA